MGQIISFVSDRKAMVGLPTILCYNLILTMNDRILKKSLLASCNGRIVDQSVDNKQTIPLYLEDNTSERLTKSVA